MHNKQTIFPKNGMVRTYTCLKQYIQVEVLKCKHQQKFRNTIQVKKYIVLKLCWVQRKSYNLENLVKDIKSRE